MNWLNRKKEVVVVLVEEVFSCEFLEVDMKVKG